LNLKSSLTKLVSLVLLSIFFGATGGFFWSVFEYALIPPALHIAFVGGLPALKILSICPPPLDLFDKFVVFALY
jgi:hypothetical protein